MFSNKCEFCLQFDLIINKLKPKFVWYRLKLLFQRHFWILEMSVLLFDTTCSTLKLIFYDKIELNWILWGQSLCFFAIIKTSQKVTQNWHVDKILNFTAIFMNFWHRFMPSLFNNGIKFQTIWSHRFWDISSFMRGTYKKSPCTINKTLIA